jgi:hypothetical protein
MRTIKLLVVYSSPLPSYLVPLRPEKRILYTGVYRPKCLLDFGIEQTIEVAKFLLYLKVYPPRVLECNPDWLEVLKKIWCNNIFK